MEIEDYIILSDDIKKYLVQEVMNKIKEGYIPQGGVSLSRTVDKQYDYEKRFAQAMIKYKKEDNSGSCTIS